MTSKKQQLAQEISKVVGAGKAVALETVDFNDPNRPKTCLEVDFPILRINELAAVEASSGATKKPIYQLSKWWARRQPSVFRSILLSAVARAPADAAYAGKLVWDNYYANHQKRAPFKHIKVADIFMGGGTTLVEGTRLGMRMIGNDLNPVAWFVVKQQFSRADSEEVSRLLKDIEANVKPQIMPYYYCHGPKGERGSWTHLPSNRVMGSDFDPLSIPIEERRDYRYEGPEVIYTFWAKHGPCQVTGCGHRTPVVASPVIAVKKLSVRFWQHKCSKCAFDFHIEEKEVRMSPDSPFVVSQSEHAFSVLHPIRGVVCPRCEYTELVKLKGEKSKFVELSLVVHPEWLAGSACRDQNGKHLGGAAQDEVALSSRWWQVRSAKSRLIEVRGELPEELCCPDTNQTIKTRLGTVPRKSAFACSSCGAIQDVLGAVKATSKTAPMAAYAVQAYSPAREKQNLPYKGRFFMAYDHFFSRQLDAAAREWDARKDADLANYWPRSELSRGWKTHGWAIPDHGFTHYWTMFNPRQLLLCSLILKSILNIGEYSWETREYVLAAFQQYLRNNNSFSFWNIQADQLEPHFSNNNYHPKALPIENNFVAPMGRGNWNSCTEGLGELLDWAANPWETVASSFLETRKTDIRQVPKSKSQKAWPHDPVGEAEIWQGSSTDLMQVLGESIDLVITDPPFGEIMQYAELADFFYVWLRLALNSRYPDVFGGEYSPKSMEAVANPFREPEDPAGFYKRLLTGCWREAFRILKAGGILAFTFHHDRDEAWASVLESLFDAGFYLEATYPIRSDQSKGENSQFGSQKIEYDIIHVCRKRTEEPKPVSWARMRREVMADVRQLQAMLENHAKEGLPAADLQVIRRGKALEYFSRHYGKVYVDEGRVISVKDALIGINQLIDEGASEGKDPPPVNAEPMTRQFLRTFGEANELKRDQLQKFLKGSITTPDDFVQRGWCTEKSKIFTRVNPLHFAQDWSGKHRRRLTSDLDQALVLIGACFDSSGINASDTLRNENFKPHIALKPLLEWMRKNGPDQATRSAAGRADSIYTTWLASQAVKPVQGTLFEEYQL